MDRRMDLHRLLGGGTLVVVAFVGVGTASCDDGPSLVVAPEGGAAPGSDAPLDAAVARAADASPERPSLRVLFIGNSYTYVNDVPGLLARIAASSTTGPRIVTDSVAKGGASLSEHLADGVAASRIAERTWTHVVLQQQSQLSAGGLRGVADPAAQKLGAMIVDAGARPTWFVTWARAPGDGIYFNTFQNPTRMQDLITRGYGLEAQKLPGSLLACVGEAFRSALRDHPEIALHQADKSHATLAGSYLAAATFYVALSGAPVPEESEAPAGLSPSEVAALRESARVGSACADLKLRADVHLVNVYGATVYKPYEIGTLVTPTLDIGTTATSVPVPFDVVNGGELAADVTWVLGGPIGWHGLAFPGASADAGAPSPPCGASLPPLSRCRLVVDYAASGPASLALSMTNAYDDVVSVPITGTQAPLGRALLTVGRRPMWPAPPAESLDYAKCGPVANLVVSNRGTAPTTSVTGKALDAPFAWGSTGFPGGSGMATSCPLARDPDDVGVTLPYCTQVIAPGESCLVGIVAGPGVSWGSYLKVAIAYGDATGPAAADATMTAYAMPAPSTSDGGADAATD